MIQLFGVLCGLSVCLLSQFGSSRAYLYIFCALYGALSGPSYQFSSGAVHEIFDREDDAHHTLSTNAQTYTLAFRAVPVLLSAPLGAAIRDAYQSYSEMWLLTGVLYVACALPIMWLGLHPVLRAGQRMDTAAAENVV